MPKLNKIYTKNGDLGKTYLANGEMIPKSHLRIENLAYLDSLMVEVGASIHLLEDQKNVFDHLIDQLNQILNRLFDQGAVIALAPNAEKLNIQSIEISIIENWIDQYNQELAPLENFVLPVGNSLITNLHRSRTQCRHLEQKLWELNETETLDPNLLIFFNRLSDYLFTAIRFCTKKINAKETVWITGTTLQN